MRSRKHYETESHGMPLTYAGRVRVSRPKSVSRLPVAAWDANLDKPVGVLPPVRHPHCAECGRETFGSRCSKCGIVPIRWK